jgi:hypothetical protein
MPHVMKRIQGIAQSRLNSPTQSVREFAEKPILFTQDRQPKTSYLAIPEVSSENRRFIPIDYFDANIIASNMVLTCEGANLYHFGILCSSFHNAWVRSVCGRLESRYRYSPAIYNNFPWIKPTDKQIKVIAEKAQNILNVRLDYNNSTLADLYNPLTMPPALIKAHNELDKAVDLAYNYKGNKDDASRVAFLFGLYQSITAPILPKETVKKPRKTK